MMRRNFLFLGLFAVLSLAVVGCAQNISPGTYTTGEVGAASRVEKATIISMRAVQIDNKSGVGGAAGAIAGGVAGSAIGGGTRANALGAIAGAVIGGVAGQAADKAIHKKTGMEYILRIRRNGRTVAITQVDELGLHVGQHVLIIYGQMTRVVPDSSYQ